MPVEDAFRRLQADLWYARALKMLLLTLAAFYLSENLAAWLEAFRGALATRGLPRKLYVDNGAAFRSQIGRAHV